MANLEQSGGQTLDKLKELIQKFGEAEKTFDQSEEEMKKAQTQLDQDWAKVEKASEGFLKQVDHEREDLTRETQDTLQGISELKQKVTDITEKAKDAAHDAKEELDEFAQDVQKLEPEIERLMKQIDDAAKSLKDRAGAIEHKLEEVADQVGNFLEQEIVNDFKELQSEVEQRAEDLKDYIVDECIPKMGDKAEELAGKLTEFGTNLGNKMQETGEHAKDQAEQFLQSCFQEFQSTIDEIMNLGSTLQQALDALCGIVDTAGETVHGVKEAVDTGVDTTNVGLNGVVGTINELMEFFSRFSFIGGI